MFHALSSLLPTALRLVYRPRAVMENRAHRHRRPSPSALGLRHGLRSPRHPSPAGADRRRVGGWPPAASSPRGSGSIRP
ncbi:protein of unknown function [Candidatus Methylocalor cossyra]|uniref:Uncharacterized protein n=1 Tax=Candidatus Methylocalor cossyra TaxID=3108543 RepID=A0ABM9NL65_9GAMM